MNWLTNFVKPKISALVRKRKNVPDNLWRNCPNCGNMVHHKDLFENLHVCNSCNYHFRMPVQRRIDTLFGSENFNQVNTLKQNIPNSELKIFNGCSHNVHLELPDKFNKYIADFLLKN